jgi:nitroimidazol reductase NimA-like FMN-containing flavoprotein (pyridoxamine 5'-phosphate oxidase superfamily)
LDAPLPKVVKDYVASAPVCRIASVRPDGAPHVIPVCPVFDGDRTIYVDLGPASATANALRHERRITVLIDDYFDDWSRLRKVILRCTAERVTDAEQDEAWERIRAKFPQHAEINWRPRQTMALRIDSWLQEGVETAAR